MSTLGRLILLLASPAVLCICHSRNMEASEPAAAATATLQTQAGQLPRNITSAPLSPRWAVTDGPQFLLLSSDATGVHFVNPLDAAQPLPSLYHSGTACGGVAIGDADGDGRPDLYLLSGPGKNRLYRQVGDFKFSDITESAGVDGGEAWGTGAAFADIDNDGDLDLYVCNYDAPNQLYVNRGDGTFNESAEDRGVAFLDASLWPSFCDYDRDGDLDLYVLTNRYYRPGGEPEKRTSLNVEGRQQITPELEKYYHITEVEPGRRTITYVGRADFLARNNGDGTFTDITEQVGMRGRYHGLSATWWDYNRDGWPDLYIANDFMDPDQLYRNNGDGTFTDVITRVMPHTPWYAMGADIGDVNNDGRMDLLVADMAATSHFMEKTTMGDMSNLKYFMETSEPRQLMRNAAYLGSGTDRFMEASHLTGLAQTNWTWSVKIADFDNDGRVDVFFTNGHAQNTMDADFLMVPLETGRTIWEAFIHAPPRPEANLAFRNLGDLHFQDVSRAWGLDHDGMSYAAAYADLDRDGDLDLVISNLDEPVHIYRNNSTQGHRVLIRLVGSISNRFGLNATVRIQTDSGTQLRHHSPMTGFISCNEPLVHFGLGADQTIKRLSVEWTSGQVQEFENLPTDRFYTITEPKSPLPLPERPIAAATMFVPADPKIFRGALHRSARHRETTYDDYARQPLLPNKLSQLGPGHAWGDVDGDGDDDLYLSGAAGWPGMLRVNRGDGSFEVRDQPAFRADYKAEDMAPLFLDADSDGDMDLYVVSGGVECEPESDVLRDRLYLNDGSGNFNKASEAALPKICDSGSALAAADFDRDGDLDLFVGSRSIPGQYPLTPESRLLRNDNGRFTDVTDQIAPGLRKTGMVTAAVFSDANDDGWIDLLLTCDWGPVKLWQNLEGKLIDQTRNAGLADRLGWWSGIAARDLDNDGDIDYVLSNLGLNTKYHPSAQKPAIIYYGDFDGSGNDRMVEAADKGGGLLPIRGKSCSQNAIPHLRQKFGTYRDFALASLESIYTEQCLSAAKRFEVNTAESGVLINDGQGRFSFRPLPRIAQISPAFGLVLSEVDGDGNADLYMVQNFFHPQRETGRMDSGLSLLLTGNGDGSFEPVWPDRSGLIVPGDAKSLTNTDLNGDGWQDFVIGVNDGNLLAYLRNANNTSPPLSTVRLKGKGSNLQGIGARVTLQSSDGSRQTAEVCAGSGYLSQSSAELVFGRPALGRIEKVTVRWPDGKISVHTDALDEPLLQP